MIDTPRFRLGCDVGGTFTDFLLYEEASGAFEIFKCLSTPRDPSEAILRGIDHFTARHPGLPGALDMIVHGTTLASNAVIEKKGARTGLITTEGFRDTIEIGREHRYDISDIFAAYPKPLVPRFLRVEVRERITADGQVLRRPRPAEVARIVKKLVREGVESIAVCLLHAYVDRSNEAAVAAVVREVAPGIAVSLSSDVLCEIREFERTTATVVNAYIKPLMHQYLSRLRAQLAERGFAGQLFLMLSNGNVCRATVAEEFPVRVIESGPAAGAVAARRYGELSSAGAVLSFDMGGTTAKLCLINDAKLPGSNQLEIARTHRMKRGSGISLPVRSVDLIEIGAGGGSIATLDTLGMLRVGPDSAGAEPGPACYGLGGTEPTVTDADLVLGYLDPDYFLGGEMQLDAASARAAIERKVAVPLGVSLEEAAWRIYDLVTENMAAAGKTHIVERGEDASGATLVAFGGAGPVHGYDLAMRMGIRRMLVPIGAGVTSAFGFLSARTGYDGVRTYRKRLDQVGAAELEQVFDELARDVRHVLATPHPVKISRSVDVQYAGQLFEINVELPDEPLTDPYLTIRRLFEDNYKARYGFAYDDIEVELINVRVIGHEIGAELPIREWDVRGAGTALKGRREAFCHALGRFVTHDVYDRYALAPGTRFSGPAIVEERESTCVVGPAASVSVDRYGSLVITW